MCLRLPRACREEGLPNANVDSTGYPDNSADTTNSAQVLNGHVNVSDPDNDPLTVTLSNPPAGITVAGQPVTWTLSPDGHTLSATVVLNAVVTPVMTITIVATVGLGIGATIPIRA